MWFCGSATEEGSQDTEASGFADSLGESSLRGRQGGKNPGRKRGRSFGQISPNAKSQADVEGRAERRSRGRGRGTGRGRGRRVSSGKTHAVLNEGSEQLPSRTSQRSSTAAAEKCLGKGHMTYTAEPHGEIEPAIPAEITKAGVCIIDVGQQCNVQEQDDLELEMLPQETNAILSQPESQVHHEAPPSPMLEQLSSTIGQVPTKERLLRKALEEHPTV